MTATAKPWRTNAVLLAFTLLIVALALESGFRLVLPDSEQAALPLPFASHSEHSRRVWRSRQNAATRARQYGFDVPDPLLGWRLRPDAVVRSAKDNAFDVVVSSNPQGLRGTRSVAQQKDPGLVRIAVFGDSQTFGEGVNDDQTFTEQLQQLLGEKAEVLNFGVHGYGTDQMLLHYESTGKNYQPDVVVLAFAWFHMMRNTATFNFYAKPKFELTAAGLLELTGTPIPDPAELLQQPPLKPVIPWSEHSVLLRWVWQRVWNLEQRQLYSPDSEAWSLTRALIRRFADAVNASGGQFVLMSIDETQQRMDSALAPFARELEIGLLDLSAMQRRMNADRTEYRIANDGHWNADGHHAVATAMRDYFCNSADSAAGCQIDISALQRLAQTTSPVR